MRLLADVLDPAELAIAVEKGLVRTQRDPSRAVRSEHKFALFLRLDGKDYPPVPWQHARPAADLNSTEPR